MDDDDREAPEPQLGEGGYLDLPRMKPCRARVVADTSQPGVQPEASAGYVDRVFADMRAAFALQAPLLATTYAEQAAIAIGLTVQSRPKERTSCGLSRLE